MPSLNWFSQPGAIAAALPPRRAGGGGGGDAVLEPAAIVGEVGQHLAVVQLDGAEVAVGDTQHTLARAALLGREDLVELGVVDHLRDVAERRGQRSLAVDHRLDLVDRAGRFTWTRTA